jgi:hypothetical protein
LLAQWFGISLSIGKIAMQRESGYNGSKESLHLENDHQTTKSEAGPDIIWSDFCLKTAGDLQKLGPPNVVPEDHV